MADVISPTNQIESLSAVTSNDIGTVNAVQPPTTLEYNHIADDPFSSNGSAIGEQPLRAYIPLTSWSRDASRSSFGHVYSEKIPERSPRRLLYTQSAFNNQEQTAWSKASDGIPTPIRYGTYRDSMADDLSRPIPRKRKSGGLRAAIRRIFGRKSAKDRISLPAPAEVHIVSYKI